MEGSCIKLHALHVTEKARDAVHADGDQALARLVVGHHVQHNGRALARPTVHPWAPRAALALPARPVPPPEHLAALGPIAELERLAGHVEAAQVKDPAQASSRAAAGLRGDAGSCGGVSCLCVCLLPGGSLACALPRH
jgi:hypothetical protein